MDSAPIATGPAIIPGDVVSLTLRVQSESDGRLMCQVLPTLNFPGSYLPYIAVDAALATKLDTLPLRPAGFPRVTENPAVQRILDFLGTAISAEVNVPALERLVVTELLFHPQTNPVPVLLAHAETLFPQPKGRAIIVDLLGYLAPKPVAAFVAGPPADTE